MLRHRNGELLGLISAGIGPDGDEQRPLERRRRDIHKSFSFLKYIFGFSKKKTTRRDKGAAISVGRVGGGLKLVFEGEGGKVAVHRRGLRLVLGPLLLGRFNGFLLSSS